MVFNINTYLGLATLIPQVLQTFKNNNGIGNVSTKKVINNTGIASQYSYFSFFTCIAMFFDDKAVFFITAKSASGNVRSAFQFCKVDMVQIKFFTLFLFQFCNGV